MVDWWAQLNNALYAIIAAIVTAFAVLIRKVLTNEKQISILQAEIDERNKHRKEMDERVEGALTELRNDVKDILKRM